MSSRTDASGTTYVTRDNDGRVISERSGTGIHRYYTSDGLGSTVSLTDASGTETSSYSYDPLGNRVAGAGSAEAMFEFAGGYRMANGLYHFGARYYDPMIGRFTQQDPLDQVAELRQGNRYLYAGDDPVNLIDPSGRKDLTAGGGCGFVGAGFTQDTTGRRSGKTRFAGVNVGLSYPGCAASAIAYTGDSDKKRSVGVTACAAVFCVSADSDKGIGFGLGIGIGVSLGDSREGLEARHTEPGATRLRGAFSDRRLWPRTINTSVDDRDASDGHCVIGGAARRGPAPRSARSMS